MIYISIGWLVLIVVCIVIAWWSGPRIEDEPEEVRQGKEIRFALPGMVVTLVPHLVHLIFMQQRMATATLEFTVYLMWWIVVIARNVQHPQQARLLNWLTFGLQMLVMYLLRSYVF